MKRNKFKTIRKRILFGFFLVVILFGVCGVGISFGINYWCVAVPPKLDSLPQIINQSVEVNGDVRQINGCILKRGNGILRMTLSGDPFTLGYCNTALSQPFLEEQEHHFINMIHEFVPSKVAVWLLTKLILIRNRNLPTYIPLDQQIEIYGLSCAYKDPMTNLGPIYHRMLNYHAAHDISHAVMDNPLVGCTSFAAWGAATGDNHLLLARNFDFNAGRCFDENKIVFRVKPDRGLGYISVAWPGMIGVVSGMNDSRIAVTINASYTKLPGNTGIPVALMLREVMQYADSIEKAISIIQQANVSVADSYLLADGKTNEVVVVEKTPDKVAIRRPREGSEFIVCANHFLTPEMSHLPGNQSYLEEGTTAARHDRMLKLCEDNLGSITPEICADILRDQFVPGGQPGGWGHPAAINCYIATHAVIMDVTQGITWVSQSPHQLGAFIPFGLDEFEHPVDAKVIPAAPELNGDFYERLLQYDEAIKQGQKLFRKKKYKESSLQFEVAHKLNPNLYIPPFWLGKTALAQKEYKKAQKWLQLADTHYPAYKSERLEIKEGLKAAKEMIRRTAS